MRCKKSLTWGYLTVFGAALIHISFAYSSTIGNMNSYLVSYMNITAGETVWFHAVLVSGQAVAMPIGGLLELKIGFRPVVAIGSITCSAGVALSALTVSHGIGPFIVTYTVMFGLGMGLPYTVLFTLAGAWFPKHRAFVIGIILIGQGIGTLLFTLTQTALIDQRDLPTNNSLVLKKLPQSFLILASIMFAFQFIGFFLCRAYQPGTDSKGCTRKASYELEFDDDVTHQSSTSEFESGPSQISEIYNYTISEALRSIDFYLLAFTIFINTISVTLQSSLYKEFGAANHLDNGFLSKVASCTTLFNVLGRVIWGLLCDHISFKLPLSWMLLQWALLFATFPLITKAGAFQPLFAVWVFLLFFTMAGHFVLLPGACSRIFGPKYMATTFGLLHLTSAPSALILSAIMSHFKIINEFNLVFFCCCGLCILSFVNSLFIKDERGKFGKITKVCANACDFCRPVTVVALNWDEEAEEGDDPGSAIFSRASTT